MSKMVSLLNDVSTIIKSYFVGIASCYTKVLAEYSGWHTPYGGSVGATSRGHGPRQADRRQGVRGNVDPGELEAVQIWPGIPHHQAYGGKKLNNN